jgi:hypothetical protein
MKILGIDPGLKTLSFGCGPALTRLHIGSADVSLHRSRSA